MRLPLAQQLPTGQWILVIGAMTAMFGWITSAFVTIKNSVKQHTINTLLQSRLSVTYMKYADIVNTQFGDFAKKHTFDPKKWGVNDPVTKVDQEALRYLLNYFEFVALGIRHGDLHEGLLRSSLRSILRSSVIFSKSYILDTKVNQPRVYINLMWLFEKWNIPNWFERLEDKLIKDKVADLLK